MFFYLGYFRHQRGGWRGDEGSADKDGRNWRPPGKSLIFYATRQNVLMLEDTRQVLLVLEATRQVLCTGIISSGGHQACHFDSQGH